MKKYLILLLPLVCSCVALEKRIMTGLEKDDVISTHNNNKIIKTIYSRYGNKILTIEKNYNKGKLDGPIKQTITFDNKIVLDLLIYKEDYIYHVYPENEYDVNINCNKSKLLSVCIMKGPEFIEIFTVDKNLLLPIADDELKKTQEASKAIESAFKELE